MSDTVKTWGLQLELDKVLGYAVILAREDLMKPTESRSVRVEYLFEPGTALDHLSVWSVGAGGYQESGVRLLDVGLFGPSKWGTLREQALL